ncbi:CotH kinase family protein [Actinoplanes sp. NPDC051494]|uniref:CotH kinase family protein n=1 Tax=Actinoplanes sp. NPDC051494 TaxID=3363907 RepID=UPI0037BE1605
MGRTLRQRIPVRVRHYWKLLAVCGAFVVTVTLVVNTTRIRPYVTSGSAASGDQVTVDLTGSVDLFDAAVPHSIQLTFRDDDYQRALDAYFDDGEKEYVEADLRIDGLSVPSVGIRLKGNSTLGGLTRNGVTSPRRGAGGAPGGGGPGGGAPGGAPGGGFPGGGPDGGFPGGGFPGGADQGGFPGGAFPGGAFPGGADQGGADQGGADQGAAPGGAGPGRGGGFGRASLRAEQPETLPWLIRFDEFVDGRRYQGHREVTVRVAGMGGGSTVLNEAVTLDVLAQAGEVAQRYAYTTFTINDRPRTARLVVEHPDEHFADGIDGSGVLYKALAGSQFTDQGDDQTDYQDDFKQITKKGSQDLQPVIDLIKWVNTSSDEAFAADLDKHVDVASFARYAALQNLLLNFDDMAGPGRNYYLWYDLGSKRFSVVGWDYNLTLSGDPAQGPHAAGRMGGGGGGFGGHVLKERFLAAPAFTEVYEKAYATLYRKIFADDTALSALDRITGVLATVDGAAPDTVTSDAQQLRTVIEQRTTALAADPVLRKG